MHKAVEERRRTNDGVRVGFSMRLNFTQASASAGVFTMDDEHTVYSMSLSMLSTCLLTLFHTIFIPRTKLN